MLLFIDLPMLGRTLKLPWIPKYFGPNWPFCRDIENYVAIECLVFVVGLCRSMQFSITAGSMIFFLDSVVIDLDNIAT